MEFDYSTVALIARGIERILIVLIGGVLMYLGYRLFHRSVSSKTKLDARYQTLSLSLESTAPGIYFCLFGTSLLVFSVINGVTTNDPENGNGDLGARTSYGVSFDSIASNTDLRNAVRGISTLEHIALTSDGIESEEVLHISEQLSPLRKFFISSKYGPEAYQSFLLIREQCRAGAPTCSSLVPQLMKETDYADIESLFDPQVKKYDE